MKQNKKKVNQSKLYLKEKKLYKIYNINYKHKKQKSPKRGNKKKPKNLEKNQKKEMKFSISKKLLRELNML